MNKEDINPTTLELLKLCQLQEQYISFLEIETVPPQQIASIHGWKIPEAAIKTGDQLRKLIKDLKWTCEYEAMKNIIIPPNKPTP